MPTSEHHTERTLGTRLLKWIGSIALAATVWLPCVHFLFRPAPTSGPQWAEGLAKGQLAVWRDPMRRERELERMRRSNAEWDFMGRTFLALSCAELALRDEALQGQVERSAHLVTIDAIVEETLRLEREHGMHFFLMPYSRSQPYLFEPARSLFLDGEIALMLGARCLVAEHAGFRAELVRRVAIIVDSLQRNPLRQAESYPDECWMFDHAMALVALRLADRIEGTDHRPLIQEWLSLAKARLVDPQTGLLVSSFTTRAEPLDGPEGSTLWITAHCLRVLDEAFARDQYARAKQHLAREWLGFAWSREWPAVWKGPVDIDSGAVIPGLEVSAGASGLAFAAAASFGDREFFGALRTTLDFAAFPKWESGTVRYCASNAVGDSAMLYAAVLGPLWERIAASPGPQATGR